MFSRLLYNFFKETRNDTTDHMCEHEICLSRSPKDDFSQRDPSEKPTKLVKVSDAHTNCLTPTVTKLPLWLICFTKHINPIHIRTTADHRGFPKPGWRSEEQEMQIDTSLRESVGAQPT